MIKNLGPPIIWAGLAGLGKIRSTAPVDHPNCKKKIPQPGGLSNVRTRQQGALK